ncbi:ZYRO0B00814p [Zygosaccharomyces rouxii]|uniref:ZYRO0B00814p n=1 Tax=Zygosaccharomyces rouxii (strain ATCC 2623 / CBS 732 / NBRC 1130 / NCYC 568 / NRRL Y-229) TaxID=559307 RepID=C5DQJ5_ZYGRC|nr:uncharacterized protein ZYRO0B00814g [Zygosaccharomyces rouxii]KAH9200392.1 hypothetical protein LQ764DRAFT_210175 [Zygosaccharomyces rouxii]CAR26056.1 ZYRO0B00814p [Zygosaccharomyces rouxii]
MSAAPSSVPNQTIKPQTRIEKLFQLTKTLQFAWFCGHAITLVFSTLYFITYCPKIYRVAYAGVLESFGIITYQHYYLKQSSLQDRSLTPSALLLNDDLLYFGMAFVWFITPRFALSLVPYAVFSLFHVLIYCKSVLLPQVFDMSPGSKCVGAISNFIHQYNERSMYWMGSVEIFTWVWLTLRALLFRRRSWIVWLSYSFFLKVRFENSKYIKSSFAQWRVRLDGIVSHSSVPPMVKQWYHRFEVLLLKVSRYRLSKDTTTANPSPTTQAPRPHYQ